MKDRFPPSGYIAGPSAVEGIEVYVPASVEGEAHREVVDFVCPQCGAATAYSVMDGALRCAHCGYVRGPQKRAVGRSAEQFEFTLETLDRAARGWGEARRELQCQHCGAALSIPAQGLTSTCPFCGSNRVIQREVPQDVLRPRFLIPFKVQAAVCRDIAGKWLGSSWMTPTSLRHAAGLNEFAAIYLPFWTFDADATAEWRAEVGHTETRTHYRDGKSESETETVWEWKNGRLSQNFDDWLIAGTRRISTLLLDRVQASNFSELTPYEPHYLAGLQAQAYDFPLKAAWNQGRKEMRDETRRRCMQQIGSSLVRNFSMQLDFSNESWRYILLPFYLTAYTYEGRTFQVVVNGQTGAISGQRPVDWNKVWLVIAAVLAPGLLLTLLGGLTLVLGIGVPVAIGGGILLIVGVIVSLILFFKARGMDDA